MLRPDPIFHADFVYPDAIAYLQAGTPSLFKQKGRLSVKKFN